jgi:exoribonuclease R
METALSLTAGRSGPALSMGVVLDGHGGIEDMTVVASTVRITCRCAHHS